MVVRRPQVVHERPESPVRPGGRRDDDLRGVGDHRRCRGVIVDRARVDGGVLVRRLELDLAAELLEARLEGVDDGVEVDDRVVLREVGGLPAVVPGDLSHRGALVLRDVAEAEAELGSTAEGELRRHLIGADARCDREQVVLDRRLLDDRRGVVHVTRREDDLRALADQLVCARLGGRRVVALGIAGLDHDLAAVHALLVDLLDLELRRSEGRPVERPHRARAVVSPADDDRPLGRRVCSSRGSCGEDERRSGNDNERPTRPLACPHVSPLRPAASAGTLLFDQVLVKASRPRCASSAASRSQSESGYALPKAPLSEKISRS